MKKILIRIVIAVVVLFIIAVVAVVMSLDSIVKKGVETAGPMITKVDVRLSHANISLFGSAYLKGLLVGNPPGYKTDSAIKVGEISVSLKPRSILADKVVIESVRVISPEITIEGSPRDNNLTKILDNVTAVAGGSGGSATKSESKGGGKKIQIGELTVSGTKVHANTLLSSGQTVTLTIPDIHFTNLGTGPEGITAAELTKQVMDKVMAEVIPALTKELSNLGKGVIDAAGKGAGAEATKSLDKAAGGLKGLFKK